MRRLLVGLLAVSASLLCGFLSTDATARQRMSFRPGDRSRPDHHHGRAGRQARPTRHFAGRSVSRAPHAAGRGGGAETESGEAAKPGAGFKMEDGVLTYPAPERFQPRNLRHH